MSEQALLNLVSKLKRSKVKEKVKKQIHNFEQLGKRGKHDKKTLFKELCFCILTANYNAEKAIKIQQEINNGFLKLNKKSLAKKLKTLGYRFPNTRASYIIDARKHFFSLKFNLTKDSKMLRDLLRENIKGIGMKEASHFLRNIGIKDVAIIDFHVLDVLLSHGLLKQKPKTLSKRTYLKIERLLKKIANKLNISLAELDLYLWYAETGKILK